MNRPAIALTLLACIVLAVGWFWREKPAPQLQAQPESLPASLGEKLNTIIIPDYPTSDVTLEEAVEFLRFKSRDHDTSVSELWKRGVNFVIIAGGERRLPAKSILPLKDIPLGEALRHVTGLVGLKFTIEQHAVVIREPQDMRTTDHRKTSALQQQLEKMIRPTVNFGDATLEEAVEYLRTSHGCLDVGDAPIIAVPLNFALHLREGIVRPLVSLDLRDIPMSEALHYCAEISNAKLRYDTAAVMITDIEADVSVPNAPSVSPILPTVEFQDATLEAALDFVRIKSRELNPDHSETLITLKPGGTSPPITLFLKSISIHETLRYIAELSGHTLSYDGRSYMLTPIGVK